MQHGSREQVKIALTMIGDLVQLKSPLLEETSFFWQATVLPRRCSKGPFADALHYQQLTRPKHEAFLCEDQTTMPVLVEQCQATTIGLGRLMSSLRRVGCNSGQASRSCQRLPETVSNRGHWYTRDYRRQYLRLSFGLSKTSQPMCMVRLHAARILRPCG